MRYRTINQIVFACVLFFIGTILLLVDIGIISLEIKQIFIMAIPYFLFLYSALVILQKLIKKREGSFGFAFFLLIYSGLLILDQFRLIQFHYADVFKLWPLLLIYISYMVLFKKKKIKLSFSTNDAFSSEIEEKEETEDEENHVKVSHSDKKMKVFSIGDVKLNKPNWDLEPMGMHTFIGDFFIDFNKAFIPEKENIVTVESVIGDVKMLIPADLPVDIFSQVKVGDIRLFDQKADAINRALTYRSDNYDEASRKIKISIKVKIGSIRIDKV
ncbi:cell wall-active antibiotics response protein [Bacillaceae bacterium Marseille-Q3522]|nr:cell wall-active antibiotics response protein [Bacillaceae bacterium Marseille-Q3522]